MSLWFSENASIMLKGDYVDNTSMSPPFQCYCIHTRIKMANYYL